MRKIFTLLAAVSAAIFAGCTNVSTFDYSAASGTMSRFQDAGMSDKTIAVLPFMDQRGVKFSDPDQYGQAQDHPAGEHGSFYLGLIPLFPFGYLEKEEPENSDDFVSLGRFHFDAQNDLANAAFLSLKASNLFGKVIKANNISQAKADYIWRGKVENTCYRGYMYSYCITYFLSPALWVLGAPYGTSANELWVTFELVERSSGKVIWTYRYNGTDYVTHWIYARIGQDTDIFPRLMKQAMNSALFDLSRELAK